MDEDVDLIVDILDTIYVRLYKLKQCIDIASENDDMIRCARESIDNVLKRISSGEKKPDVNGVIYILEPVFCFFLDNAAEFEQHTSPNIEKVIPVFLRVISDSFQLKEAVQNKILDLKLHVLVIKLIFSCRESTLFVKTCFEFLANMGYSNEKCNELIFCVLARDENIPILLEIARKNSQIEPLLLLLSRVLPRQKCSISDDTLIRSTIPKICHELVLTWLESIDISLPIEERDSHDLIKDLIIKCFSQFISFDPLNDIINSYISSFEHYSIHMQSFLNLLNSIVCASTYNYNSTGVYIVSSIIPLLNFFSSLISQISIIYNVNDHLFPCTRLTLDTISNILSNISSTMKLGFLDSTLPNDLVSLLLSTIRLTPKDNFKELRTQSISAPIHFTALISSPIFNFKCNIIYCITALAIDLPAARSLFARLEVVPLLLNSTSISQIHPLQREYSIIAIKILCNNCPANINFIENLKSLSVDPDTRDLILNTSKNTLDISLSSQGHLQLSKKSPNHT